MIWNQVGVEVIVIQVFMIKDLLIEVDPLQSEILLHMMLNVTVTLSCQ